ncbi:MAG: hypothetical protein GX030_07180 [Firmicutes bacterium]|nr:hypothetical protein [Bacillota bacterium]
MRKTLILVGMLLLVMSSIAFAGEKAIPVNLTVQESVEVVAPTHINLQLVREARKWVLLGQPVGSVKVEANIPIKVSVSSTKFVTENGEEAYDINEAIEFVANGRSYSPGEGVDEFGLAAGMYTLPYRFLLKDGSFPNWTDAVAGKYTATIYYTVEADR